MNNPIATIKIGNRGELKLELYPNTAPNTVNNFIELANSGYYDGLKIHRIVTNFMVQGGSKIGSCDEISSFFIKGEFSANGIPNNIKHECGVISMARDDSFDSASTQFFIMHGTAERLDGKYAAFGKLIHGFDLLEEVCHTPTDMTPGKNNPPLVPVYTQTIRVELNDWIYTEPQRIYPTII